MTTFLSSESAGRMTSSQAIRQRYMRFLCIVLTACVLQACGRTEEPAKEEGSASSISGFNYSNEGIQEFHINGQWGGNLGIGAGYDKICCVMIPSKWAPGLSATVTWRRSDCGDEEITADNKRCPENGQGWPYKSIEVTVPIEPYDQPNSVQVMFLPNDEIKIYVSHMSPDHRDHPSKLGEPRPLDHPEWKR